MIGRLLAHSKAMAAVVMTAAMSACGVGTGGSHDADSLLNPTCFADSLSLRYGTQWGAAQNINIAMLPESESSRFDKKAYMAGLRNALKAGLTTPSALEGLSEGVSIGEQLDSYDAIGIYLRRDVVASAFSNHFRGDTLSQEDFVAYQSAYDVKVSVVQNLILEKLRHDRREQLMMNQKMERDNVVSARSFVEKLTSADSTVVKCDSGLLYKILRDGGGKKAAKGSTVRLVYCISGLDGRVIDSSRGEPVEIPLDESLIPGLFEGLRLMSEGGKARFYIPYYLGFGRDNTSVRPGEMIIVEIELVEVL